MDSKKLNPQLLLNEFGINFILLPFSDVTGTAKNAGTPIRGLDGVLEDGVWFDGSSVKGFDRIQDSDIRLRIDPETLTFIYYLRKEILL